MIGKAEVLEKGENPRFIVTNLPAEGFAGEVAGRFQAAALYEKFYCGRGAFISSWPAGIPILNSSPRPIAGLGCCKQAAEKRSV